ncbi:MAG: pyrroline-5-carboxylate reductase family protein, partial [Alphaproteobacteria bacterium]
ALAAASAELGLPEDKARRLALAMVEGAASLAASSGHNPGELARRVASPKGTTEAGLGVLDREGAFQQLIGATIEAARRRGAELAAEARGETFA